MATAFIRAFVDPTTWVRTFLLMLLALPAYIAHTLLYVAPDTTAWQPLMEEKTFFVPVFCIWLLLEVGAAFLAVCCLLVPTFLSKRFD